MSESTQSLQHRKVESTAKELAEEGYEVSIEPTSSELPFDLGHYRPDLIARKDGEGIIMDVKTRHARVSVDRYQEIADEVASHPGWRFMLVTLEDVSEEVCPTDLSDLPSWEELQCRLDRVEALIDEGLTEPAVMYLWGTIEATLRRQAIVQNLPVDRFPAGRLLNHMYSSGEVSIRVIDDLKSVLEKRNRAAHGVSVSIEEGELRECLRIARELIKQWSDARVLG